MLAIFTITFAGVSGLTMLFSTAVPLVDFMADMGMRCKWGVSMLAGVLMVAPSPASALAVVSELGARGAFVSISPFLPLSCSHLESMKIFLRPNTDQATLSLSLSLCVCFAWVVG